jgi:ubiquinone/menaquinone biosynthesis C-methylase UbiE
MTNSNASFTGMVPGIYDYELGPMFFEPYARDLARRVDARSGATILETAAGTGIVTRHLLERLPADGHLIATDLNDAMLAIARGRIADGRVQWQKADACALPFDNNRFDAVVCQFGLMFFPDKSGAMREARRVLRPGGRFLFNVWDSLAQNPIAKAAHEVAASFYHTNPPEFYTVPFGFYDRSVIEQSLTDAGFVNLTFDTVDLVGESETAERAAKGLVLGTPLNAAIQERGTVNGQVIMHAVAARLAHEGGAAPMRLPMRALVLTAEAPQT